MQTVDFKRGDTFIPECTYLVNGVPVAYAGLGVSIKSQIRTASGVLVVNLTVTAGVGIGEFTLESGSTQNWPIGKLFWDIQFTQGGHIFSTKTTALLVAEDVTV